MHAVFFCENCRKPVSLDAVECPHCGSRFTAVQCPRCSFVGKAKLFSGGCPQCGFLAPAASGPGDDAEPGVAKRRRAPSAAPRSGATANGRAGRPTRSRRHNGLPGWFYATASILLALVLVALVVIILRLK